MVNHIGYIALLLEVQMIHAETTPQRIISYVEKKIA